MIPLGQPNFHDISISFPDILISNYTSGKGTVNFQVLFIYLAIYVSIHLFYF